GDIAFDLLNKRLSATMTRTYAAANPHVLAETTPFITQRLKDKLPAKSELYVIYQFTCTCGAKYMGHTTRRLSTRIAKHCPGSLRKGTAGSIKSSILEHLVQKDTKF
ncbi:unnamed protein product, partial [Dicrocoelium dendriticum]